MKSDSYENLHSSSGSGICGSQFFWPSKIRFGAVVRLFIFEGAIQFALETRFAFVSSSSSSVAMARNALSRVTLGSGSGGVGGIACGAVDSEGGDGGVGVAGRTGTACGVTGVGDGGTPGLIQGAG